MLSRKTTNLFCNSDTGSSSLTIVLTLNDDKSCSQLRVTRCEVFTSVWGRILVFCVTEWAFPDVLKERTWRIRFSCTLNTWRWSRQVPSKRQEPRSIVTSQKAGISGHKSPSRLNFVHWLLIFLGF